MSTVNSLTLVNTDDQNLIDACLNGESEAFGELVLRHQDRLYNSLFRALGSAEDARDAAQDAFVQAYQKLESFRGDASFYSWVFRIAMNAAISEKRKTRRMNASVDAAREQSGIEPEDVHPTVQPEHSLELLEQQQMVQTALSELSEEFRTALVLKEMEGMKYDEIAEILDCPIGTVRSRIFRARSELKEKLRLLLIEQG